MNSNRKSIILKSFEVAYQQWGDSGTPIVLLHGIPMNSTLWNKNGEFLSKNGCRVFAPELLSLGYTDGPLDYDHSLLGQAAIIVDFVKKLINDSIILVGHDIGGGVAQILATKFTDSLAINGCVLTNCIAFDSWPIREIKALIRAAKSPNYSNILTTDYMTSFLKTGLPYGLSNVNTLNDDLVNDINNGLTGTQRRLDHFRAFLLAMDNKYTQTASDMLINCTIPFMLFWAQNDQFQPVTVGEKIRSRLKNPSWVVEDGKHFHPLENTDFGEAILHWKNRSFPSIK